MLVPRFNHQVLLTAKRGGYPPRRGFAWGWGGAGGSRAGQSGTPGLPAVAGVGRAGGGASEGELPQFSPRGGRRGPASPGREATGTGASPRRRHPGQGKGTGRQLGDPTLLSPKFGDGSKPAGVGNPQTPDTVVSEVQVAAKPPGPPSCSEGTGTSLKLSPGSPGAFPRLETGTRGPEEHRVRWVSTLCTWLPRGTAERTHATCKTSREEDNAFY